MWRLKQFLKRLIRGWRERQEVSRQKRCERKWKVFAAKLPRSEGGKILFHVGCGDIDAAGYINIDARPQSHVHIVTTNLLKLEMIPPATADLIYMSHVLEHVGHRDVGATLGEMHRILKPGGVLRISVPDFDKIIDIYRASNNDVTAIEQPLMGGQDYSFNFHYAVFNEVHLREVLLRNGFGATRNWDPDKSPYHDFEDWASKTISSQGREFPISLNIEAIR